MKLTGNTILVTGGGSGIGRALAESFLHEGNQVIVAGRRPDALNRVTAANPGMASAVLDIAEPNAIRSFAEQIVRDFPALNVLVQNAGISRAETLAEGSVGDAEAMVTTNLLGPIRLTAALLPTLLRQPQATVMTVSSGLAFVPLSMAPTYCATKAAVHSYSQSLRYQLQNTPVRVLELIPPYVQTELMGERQANDPNAMPLADFISEVMSILKADPDVQEICVERVKPMRFAEASGGYDNFFRTFNDRMVAERS